MTTFETLTLVSSLAIGAGQIGIVWYGIRSMNRSSEERARDRAQREAWEKQRAAQEDRRHLEAMQALDKRHEEAMQANGERHEEAMQANGERHEEAMQANGERHEEAMQSIDKHHEEAMQALAMQRRSLETLIERTAPPAPTAAD